MEVDRKAFQSKDSYWPAAGFLDKRLSQSRFANELDRTDVADKRAESERAIKALDNYRIYRPSRRPGSGRFFPIRWVYCNEKKLLIDALTYTVLDRLIERSKPLSATKRRASALP